MGADYILLCVNASDACLSFMREGFEARIENKYWSSLAGHWTSAAVLGVSQDCFSGFFSGRCANDKGELPRE